MFWKSLLLVLLIVFPSLTCVLASSNLQSNRWKRFEIVELFERIVSQQGDPYITLLSTSTSNDKTKRDYRISNVYGSVFILRLTTSPRQLGYSLERQDREKKFFVAGTYEMNLPEFDYDTDENPDKINVITRDGEICSDFDDSYCRREYFAALDTLDRLFRPKLEPWYDTQNIAAFLYRLRNTKDTRVFGSVIKTSQDHTRQAHTIRLGDLEFIVEANLSSRNAPVSVQISINDESGGSISMVDNNFDGWPETVRAKGGIKYYRYDKLMVNDLTYVRLVDFLDKEKSARAKTLITSITGATAAIILD